MPKSKQANNKIKKTHTLEESPPNPMDSGRESAAGQCASKSWALPGTVHMEIAWNGWNRAPAVGKHRGLAHKQSPSVSASASKQYKQQLLLRGGGWGDMGQMDRRVPPKLIWIHTVFPIYIQVCPPHGTEGKRDQTWSTVCARFF